jgi:hypothetical protein
MADAICRWRNGTPKTVVELVNSMPHSIMPSREFRSFMLSHWNGDFFHTPYQLACQLALYCESEDGNFYPRFDHDIDVVEAEKYLFFWLPRYYIPNPYTKKDGFQDIECPTLFLKSLYDYTLNHPNCDYNEAYKESFHEEATNNDDIVRNYINNYSRVLTFSKDGKLNLTDYNANLIFNKMDRNNKSTFFFHFSDNTGSGFFNDKELKLHYNKYLTALHTKPFLLLAGISGTGKSRLVQELAYMTCPRDGELDKEETAPGNYCLIEVKPNWHDSSELLGYYSAITGKYELTTFIRFVYKALQNPNIPFFVCLDEMNLAPVEQYFAEYLSVLETRKVVDGHIESVPLLKNDTFNNCELNKNVPFHDTMNESDPITYISNPIYNQEDATIINYLKINGLRLPENLFVIGTVNMDDTTHQFSRKVIDRAFTIEMNGGDLSKAFTEKDKLQYREEPISLAYFKSQFVLAKDVIDALPEYSQVIIQKVPEILNEINGYLKDTPFRVSYRVQNEMILYIASIIAQTDGVVEIETVIRESALAIILEKILPRVEGDNKMLGGSENSKSTILTRLKDYIIKTFITDDSEQENSDITSTRKDVLDKLDEMQTRLDHAYFTSFFS